MMNVQDVLKEVVCQFAELPCVSSEILPATNLEIDLGYDSISFIKLIIEIEEKFEIQFPDEYLDYEIVSNFQSLEEVVKTIILGEE